jgi:hypothetical protein
MERAVTESNAAIAASIAATLARGKVLLERSHALMVNQAVLQVKLQGELARSKAVTARYRELLNEMNGTKRS